MNPLFPWGKVCLQRDWSVWLSELLLVTAFKKLQFTAKRCIIQSRAFICENF